MPLHRSRIPIAERELASETQTDLLGSHLHQLELEWPSYFTSRNLSLLVWKMEVIRHSSEGW